MVPCQSFDSLLSKIGKCSSFQEVAKQLEQGESELKLSELPNSLGAFLIAHLQTKLDNNVSLLFPQNRGCRFGMVTKKIPSVF